MAFVATDRSQDLRWLALVPGADGRTVIRPHDLVLVPAGRLDEARSARHPVVR